MDIMGKVGIMAMHLQKNTTPRKLDYFDAEDEAIHLILTGIGDDIYSIVDACTTAKEIWIAIERLQQAESLNKQYVKTNNFWEFVLGQMSYLVAGPTLDSTRTYVM
ncbi:hypothetical protein Tco_1514951 [Tanacetum coccineum]